MNPRLIPSLLIALAGVSSSSTVSNPYSTASRLSNLRAYLGALCAHPYSGHLFVGEAPGYRGCAITGIPFTSERILCSGGHLFLDTILPSLTLTGSVTERSATIVWRQFTGKSSIPAFWNAFPFHPHPVGVTSGNRRPTSIEITAGTPFLHTVVEILAPHTIVAIGGVAASVTATTFPKLRHLTFPHPSYRGTAGFISGCATLNIK
jgi:uracil-DNA glycosylase